MAVGEVYQLRLTQLWNAVEESVTTFYYEQVDGATANAAVQVSTGFQGVVLPWIRAVQDPIMGVSSIEVVNIARPDDFHVQVGGGLGTCPIVGDPLVPFICLALRSAAPAPTERYSYLRIPGQNTGMINPNGQWTGAYRTEVDNLTEQLEVQLSVGGNLFNYVQVKSGVRYGIPPTVNRQLNGEWSMNVFPTTQVSRKDSFYLWVVPVT